MEGGMLFLVIFCGAGVSASLTYIACQLAWRRKNGGEREEYEFDEETLTIKRKNG